MEDNKSHEAVRHHYLKPPSTLLFQRFWMLTSVKMAATPSLPFHSAKVKLKALWKGARPFCTCDVSWNRGQGLIKDSDGEGATEEAGLAKAKPPRRHINTKLASLCNAQSSDCLPVEWCILPFKQTKKNKTPPQQEDGGTLTFDPTGCLSTSPPLQCARFFTLPTTCLHEKQSRKVTSKQTSDFLVVFLSVLEMINISF